MITSLQRNSPVLFSCYSADPLSKVFDYISFWALIGHKYRKRVLCLMGELPCIKMMRRIPVRHPDHMNPIVAGVHSFSKWKWFGSPRALLRLGQGQGQQQQQWLVGLPYHSGPQHYPQKLIKLELGCTKPWLRPLWMVPRRQEASIDRLKGQGGCGGDLTRFMSRG